MISISHRSLILLDEKPKPSTEDDISQDDSQGQYESKVQHLSSYNSNDFFRQDEDM